MPPDNDSDSQINDVATNGKLLEFIQHFLHIYSPNMAIYTQCKNLPLHLNIRLSPLNKKLATHSSFRTTFWWRLVDLFSWLYDNIIEDSGNGRGEICEGGQNTEI